MLEKVSGARYALVCGSRQACRLRGLLLTAPTAWPTVRCPGVHLDFHKLELPELCVSVQYLQISQPILLADCLTDNLLTDFSFKSKLLIHKFMSFTLLGRRTTAGPASTGGVLGMRSALGRQPKV